MSYPGPPFCGGRWGLTPSAENTASNIQRPADRARKLSVFVSSTYQKIKAKYLLIQRYSTYLTSFTALFISLEFTLIIFPLYQRTKSPN